MSEDIRDRTFLIHKDIMGLNFIKAPGIYLFRRHYREGLRSQIMEVLPPEAVKNETKGITIDGLRLFPKAKPSKMLRIFKARFNTLKDAGEEIKRVKIIGTYLAPDNIARSQEFLVHYLSHGKYEILLCGLQEYVEGIMLDPWGLLDKRYLVSVLNELGFKRNKDSEKINNIWINSVREKAETFIEKVKRLILEANHVPDLAGLGNLILTRTGNIKLVDINNISYVSFDSIIKVDDRGYPVCDKSIEALSLLERKLLKRSLDKDEPIYKTFLDPVRMNEVKTLERKFYTSMEPSITFLD